MKDMLPFQIGAFDVNWGIATYPVPAKPAQDTRNDVGEGGLHQLHSPVLIITYSINIRMMADTIPAAVSNTPLLNGLVPGLNIQNAEIDIKSIQNPNNVVK